jgi:hypothetical protein
VEPLPFLGALPRFAPECSERDRIEHGDRTVAVAACNSRFVRFPTLLWLLFGSDDSNPGEHPYVLSYACAALAVERLLPDCVVLGPGARRAGYKPKRYWMPLEDSLYERWTLGWFEGSATPSVPSGLLELLRSLPEDWQLRLAPPWVILVAPGAEHAGALVRGAAASLAGWAASY